MRPGKIPQFRLTPFLPFSPDDDTIHPVVLRGGIVVGHVHLGYLGNWLLSAVPRFTVSPYWKARGRFCLR